MSTLLQTGDRGPPSGVELGKAPMVQEPSIWFPTHAEGAEAGVVVVRIAVVVAASREVQMLIVVVGRGWDIIFACSASMASRMRKATSPFANLLRWKMRP